MSRRRHHPGAIEAPLPATLEDAISEILYLRSAIIRERECISKLIVQRERERRSIRGQLRPDSITTRLAASAPVLYAALKDIMERGEGCAACGIEGRPDCGCLQSRGRAALAIFEAGS